MSTAFDERPYPSLGATSWEGALPASPWTAADLNRLVLTSLLGGGLILAAWVGASSTPVVTRTIAWGGLGVAGLVVSFVGLTMWLLQALRGVRLASTTALRVGLESLEHKPSTTESLVGRVTAEGLSYAHRSDCLLVRGKAVHAGGDELPLCPVCLS